MNKTAKEMFEDLGYEIIENNKFHIQYFKDECFIVFIKHTKGVDLINYKLTNPTRNSYISNEKLKAIQKQIEELGWE